VARGGACRRRWRAPGSSPAWTTQRSAAAPTSCARSCATWRGTKRWARAAATAARPRSRSRCAGRRRSRSSAPAARSVHG
jgi:hypothetical protein